MGIDDVVELVAALLLSLAVWALSAAEYLLSALQKAVFGNQQLAQSGGDRHQLLEWVRTQLPDQPVHDFGAGWRDGVALRRLVDRLVTGHPSVPGRPEVTADRPVLNVNEAFRRARDVLHQPPTLTVTDVISGCDEDRLAAYVAALREAAERRGEPEHPTETPADMAEPPAAAAGTGLTAAHTGQPAQFAVRLPQAARLDLLVEMRSETGDYFSQRLTPRSPARRSLEDEAPAPVSSSGRPRSNIPVGYQVTGRTVNLWYQPPAAGWLSLSIVSGGQHVEGSPFRVYVGENEEEEGTVDDSDKKSEKGEVKEEVAKEVEKLVDAAPESVTEPTKELSEEPVKDSVIEDGKEHSERVADEPAGEGIKATVVETVKQPEPDSVEEAVVEAVKAKVSEAAVKTVEEEGTEKVEKEVESPAGPEQKEQDETVESSLDEQVQKLSMTQSESEPADERVEKVVEDSVKDSDKISAAEAVEQPLEKCSVETADEPLVAEEKKPEDEAASESVVEAPEVAAEVAERAKDIVSETIEKALQQIPLNASHKTVVDAEVDEMMEDVVGSAAEGKGESSEGITTESPEEIGEPAAKEVRELEEKEEVTEPLTEVTDADRATARTEAVQSPTRRTPPLRLLSTVQEMSVDVLVPTADDVHPDNVTPNSPVLEEQKEGEESENQENNQNEDRRPSTPIEQLSDQPDTLSTLAPHSGDKVSSDPDAEQDPLAEPESPGAAASKDATTTTTTTTIPTGEFPEAAAAVSYSQVPEPKQRSLEQTAAALVATVVSAAEAALASVDAGGDADQSAQTPNEHNEPNHPDGKPNELAEINASAAEKTEDVEEVVMPDASQASPEPSDSPDDIPDIQIHDKDSQPDINHVSENSAELVVNAEPTSSDETQLSENQTEPVLASRVSEALESQIMPTEVSPVNAQDDNHKGKDTIPVHSDKPTTPKPSRKISWQERVVVADTFDNVEADEADEEAEELFTPMSPVHEYTPSPPLYRRNTFDELVAVTDVPNSESKREVKIQQKRKLSRKESRRRHSRSRSSSGDLESPVPKDSCIERDEHPLNFALDKDVSDEEKHSAAAVDVAAVQVVAAERLPDEKVLDQSDHSIEKTEAAVKHEKNRKISFIEKIDVIEVPVVNPDDSKTEEKFDPHPKLVIQDSIDEPADWIHAPLSESKKELEVLEKVCEDNEEQTENQLPLQSDTNITPLNDKDVQSAADKTPAEPFEQPNGNGKTSVETPANEEQSEDKVTLSHVIDRSRLLQKNRILSMSTSSSDSDEKAAHMSDGQRKRSQKTSDEFSSSSDDGKSSASKAAVKSDDKNEPKFDTNDGAVKEHKEEGIPKRLDHDKSSSASADDDANKAWQKEKMIPSSTASGQGHPCLSSEDTSAKKETKSNSEDSESSTSSSDKNEATKNASQNKKKKKKKRRKRSSGSSSSSDDNRVSKQIREKDKAKPKVTSFGSSSSLSDDSKAKAEKLQQKKKKTSSSSSDTDKHESSAEKGTSKKDDVIERSKASSGSEKRASKSRSASSSSSDSSSDGSQKEASKEDKPASKPESRKSSSSSSDNNKKSEALQEEKDKPNTSDSSTSSSSSDDSSSEKKLPKKDSRKTTSRSSRSSNSSSDDKNAAVEAATKTEEAKSSSKSSSSSTSSSSDEGKCDKKRSMKDKAMPKRATSRSSSSCSDDREGKGDTTQQRNATVKPKCSESGDTSSNADSDREGVSKEEKAKLKKQSSKSSSSSSDDNAATTELKRKKKSTSSSTTSTSSSSSTDDDKAQNKALKKKKNTSRSASSSSSSDGSKRNKSTSQKKKTRSGQATSSSSSSSSSSSDDSSVEQKVAKKDKSNMKSASPTGSSSSSDDSDMRTEETRKRHTSPKPASSKDSSSSAEDNVTCGNYANEKEKSKKREPSPARTSSHSDTKSACQESNAEKESMLEEQVKLRSSSSTSSSTSEDEGKLLDRSRENAAMTEKQDDMPHTDDISEDRNQMKLEVCVSEQPSSSVADDIESQIKLPSLELATTSAVSESKVAENDTEVKERYVPTNAETLEVKVNILAETGDSVQETAPETEAIKNIEMSVDISLSQQLVRSRSDVEDDTETQERPMTVTVLPSCAQIRPNETKLKDRSDSESSSISEKIGVQEETQKTGTCTETPVIRDTTPGDSLGENKTGDEVELLIDVDQELDFDVVGLVTNVVNESRSPVHVTTQGEIQDSPVIVEKIVTDVTQENAPLGKDDALERRSSTSSESSSSGSDGEKGGKKNVDAPTSDLVPRSKEYVIVRCDEQKTENQPAVPKPKPEVLEDSAEKQPVDAGKNGMQDSPLPSTNETSSPKSEGETQQSKETSEPNQSFSDNEYQTKETNLPTFAVDDQTGKQWRKKSRSSDTSSSSSSSDDSEDSIKAKTSEAAHEKIVRASSSSSSSETSAEQDAKLSPEKTPNVIEDLCDAIIPEKPSSVSHEEKNVVKKEGSNETKNDVKTEDPTVSNTSSSSHSRASSVDDHRRDSAEHNEKQDMVKQEDEPSAVSLDIEVDIIKEVDKPAGESGKSSEPETSVVLETHMASQFAVAEEFPSSDSEDQEAQEVIIGIDEVEPTQAIERQSPPATEAVSAEVKVEKGIDDGTFGKKERTTIEVASSCDERERNSVIESQNDSLAILVTNIVPNENESQEEILTEVTKPELEQTPQHIPTPLDDISQLPVSVPKEEISLFQSPECLSETPKTTAESFDNKTETQESFKPAAPSSLPASTKPSRKYSDQYSNFETPRDSRYRLQDMQERSKSSVGQQRTRIRPQVEVTSAVLPCLVEVRTALHPSGIPSEVLENIENVTDVMKEEKPPQVAELIVPETVANVNQGNKEMEGLLVGDNVVEVSLEQHSSAMDEKHSPAAVCEKEKKTPKKETERKSRTSSSSSSPSSDSDEILKRRKTSRKSSSSSSDSSAGKHKTDKRKDSASKQPVAVKKEKQKRSSSSSSSDSHGKRQHRKSDTLATAEVGDKVAISTSSDSSSDEDATKSHRRNSVEKEGRKPSSSDKKETAPDLKDKRKPTKTSSSSGTSSSSSSSSSDENAKPEKKASSSSTSSSSSSSEDDVKNSHTHDRRKKKSQGSSSDDTEVKRSTKKKKRVNRSGSSVSSSSDKEGSQGKTSGSEKGHPPRAHKTSKSSKSSDSSSSDSSSSDSEHETKKKKDVSSVPDVKEATDEPHPKLPLAPPPTSRLPPQTSRDEEILEIVEKVLENEIGSLDRNAPSSASPESIDGKNDADQMKDDALPTSDQNGLEDWVIVPETVDETQAAPHIVNEKTRDPELTPHESSNLHDPTPEAISKEEPLEGERGQPVSEWVNMWDSAISAGLYPTPTADVSQRLSELRLEPQQSEAAASNVKPSDPETATKPEDVPSGSSSVEAPQVLAKEEAGIVRAEPARLIEDEPCVDTNVSEQPPVSGVEGAFEAILVNVVPELPIDDNQNKVEKNSEDLNKPVEKATRDKTEDETYQASLCYIDPELPSPVEKDGDDDNTCPDLMRPEDTLSESLPAFVREPAPAVWRRASVDRQVGKFNITCIIRPNEAHLHGSETRVTPPRQTDRKWLNLENYTIMPPPQSPESVRKNAAESDLGSKTTVYLTPRSPPNARQELVALRCVRNSEDDSSLTYLPELRDLTPDLGDGEKSLHWNGRSKEVDKSTVPHLHSQPPLADVKKKRLAYENGSTAAHKELRKVTPPHNANLEERKQKLLGSTADIVSKVKQPVAEPGKVGRLRAMFEQMDAAAARAPGRDDTLRDSRRFKSMMNVTAPSTTGRSSRLEEPTLKERSRSTAALHRTPSGGLGAELSVAPESVKERSRSTVNLNHREDGAKPSWDAVDSGSIKHRSRSTVGLNGTSSASPRAGLSAAPDSVKELSRSAATLHQPEKADKGEDAVDSAPAKERSPSVPRQPEGSLSPQGPTGHDSPPASSEYVTLEERALSSRALDELEDGDHQAKLDAIRRYFEGLQDGDITAGDDMDMLDDALVPDRGYNRSLPRLDASASDRRPPLTDLFTEPERGTRSLNRSASSPLVSAEGAGGAATLLDQVRQLRRRRASGGALSQTSLATSIASTAELARHRDDGIVVFGPGMCQGKVNAVNRFQILVPHADQAPMGVRLYSQRTDSVTRVELRDLGCDYHQVAYRVNQPGWYRLYVRLGGGARHVDLMTKVSH